MPLFQASVLKKQLQLQNKAIVNKAYKKFSNYFHNSKIQQNIRESKEEQITKRFNDYPLSHPKISIFDTGYYQSVK